MPTESTIGCENTPLSLYMANYEFSSCFRKAAAVSPPSKRQRQQFPIEPSRLQPDHGLSRVVFVDLWLVMGRMADFELTELTMTYRDFSNAFRVNRRMRATILSRLIPFLPSSAAFATIGGHIVVARALRISSIAAKSADLWVKSLREPTIKPELARKGVYLRTNGSPIFPTMSTHTLLTCVNSRIASRLFSRPYPLALYPPKGDAYEMLL